MPPGWCSGNRAAASAGRPTRLRKLPAGVPPRSLRRCAAHWRWTDARWSDAREMGAALKRPDTRLRWSLVAAGGMIAALLAWVVFPPPPPPAPPAPRGAVTIAIERFRVESPGLTEAFGDSVAAVFRRALEYPDFYVIPVGSSGDTAAVRVIGSARLADGRIHMIARADDSKVRVEFAGARADWEAVVDTLSRRLVKALWQREADADHWLPVRALPYTAEGFDRFFRGEQLLTQSRWEEAWVEFRGARADTSCYLCSFRLLDIERWLGWVHDPEDITRLRTGSTAFLPTTRASFVPPSPIYPGESTPWRSPPDPELLPRLLRVRGRALSSGSPVRARAHRGKSTPGTGCTVATPIWSGLGAPHLAAAE